MRSSCKQRAPHCRASTCSGSSAPALALPCVGKLLLAGKIADSGLEGQKGVRGMRGGLALEGAAAEIGTQEQTRRQLAGLGYTPATGWLSFVVQTG